MTAAPWDGLIASHFIAHADHQSLAWIPWIASRLVGRRQRAATTSGIHSQHDHCGLPHHTFTDDALHLILRSSGGILRAVRNLRSSPLIEAVRDRVKTVDLTQVNAVLMQPHWRHDTTGEPVPPLAHTNQEGGRGGSCRAAVAVVKPCAFPAKMMRATQGCDPPGHNRNGGDIISLWKFQVSGFQCQAKRVGARLVEQTGKPTTARAEKVDASLERGKPR